MEQIDTTPCLSEFKAESLFLHFLWDIFFKAITEINYLVTTISDFIYCGQAFFLTTKQLFTSYILVGSLTGLWVVSVSLNNQWKVMFKDNTRKIIFWTSRIDSTMSDYVAWVHEARVWIDSCHLDGTDHPENRHLYTTSKHQNLSWFPVVKWLSILDLWGSVFFWENFQMQDTSQIRRGQYFQISHGLLWIQLPFLGRQH